MAEEWHYSKGSQQYGPISTAELRALAKSGAISPTDMVWKEGMPGWIAAGKVKGLLVVDSIKTPPTPPPFLLTVESVSPNFSAGPTHQNSLSGFAPLLTPLAIPVESSIVWDFCSAFMA